VNRTDPHGVIRAYRSGQSIGTIAQRLGCSTSVVWKLLDRANEPRRSRSDAQRRSANAVAAAARANAVIAAYRAGLSLDAVARQVGVSKTGCWNILVRHGEPRRQFTRNTPPPP
jgi:transposase